MANKRRRGSNELLSESYRSGIERVVKVKAPDVFEIPAETIKKRQQFWNNLFAKYSEGFSGDPDFDLEQLKFVEQDYNAKDVIQHWINTTYLPYQLNASTNSFPGNTYLVMGQQLNRCRDRYSNESSFSSSVDTAAYILSNTYTANKSDKIRHNSSPSFRHTMYHENKLKNNVEDASPVVLPEMEAPNVQKDGALNSSSSTSNSDIIEVVNDKINETDSNGNNESNDSIGHQPQRSVTSELMIYSQQQNTNDENGNAGPIEHDHGANVNENISLHTENSNDTVICNNQPYNLPINASTSKHATQSTGFMTPVLNTNASKLSFRKKLYSGRDSPVDIASITSHKIYMFPKLKKLHPALNTTYSVQKQYKKKNAKRTSLFHQHFFNYSQLISKHNKSNKTKRNLSCFKDASLKLNSMVSVNENLNNINDEKNVGINNNQSVNMPLPVCHENPTKSNIKGVNKENKVNTNAQKVNTTEVLSSLKPLRKPTKSLNVGKRKYTKRANKSIKNAKNLNPVVSLTRLTDIAIQKYTKLTNFDTPKEKKLTDLNTEKHTKLNSSLCNLNPVVCLTALAESEIQKYKCSNNRKRDLTLLNAVIRLERLSEATIKKYKTSVEKDTQSKVDLSSSVPLRDNFIKNNRLALDKLSNYSKHSYTTSSTIDSFVLPHYSNVINLMSDDTYSNQSSVLLFKCNNGSSHDTLSIDSSINMQKSVRDDASISDMSKINHKNMCTINVRRSTRRKTKSQPGLQSSNKRRKLLNLARYSENTQNLNTARKQTNCGLNNEFRKKVTRGRYESKKKTTMTRSNKVLPNVKFKGNNKQNTTGLLHFETRSYQSCSDSDFSSDSE